LEKGKAKGPALARRTPSRTIMILLRKICFKELSEQGRHFNWGKHDCEKCQRAMWGHGFVSRYFAQVCAALLMKRFRCPECGVVVTLRPEGFLPHVRSSVDSIYSALSMRFRTGSWGSEISRQCAGHWLRRFVRKVRMDWGDASDLKAALEFCYQKQLSFFT
jgi:hypothetical protein